MVKHRHTQLESLPTSHLVHHTKNTLNLKLFYSHNYKPPRVLTTTHQTTNKDTIYPMNSNHQRSHQGSPLFIWTICYIAFFTYLKELAFSPYMLTTYITTYTKSTTTYRTPTITTTLPLTLIHTQTQLLTLHNNTKPTTHIHITHQLHNISPTYPYSHSDTTNAHNNMPHTTANPSPIPNIIIHHITYMGQISHITHLHLRTPKAKTTKYYTWNNSKIILLSGDIQPNPGPLSNITQHLPLEYQQRQKQYFTPNTTSLKPRYTHLESLFTPHLTHGIQNSLNQDLTHLQRHKSLLSKYPIHLQIYALIITYSPIPQICNQRMITGIDPIGHTLLRQIHELSNSIQSHILLQTNPTHNPQPTTIAQAYTHINTKIAKDEPINITTLKNELPYIPPQILQELTKCTLPIIGYHPNINPSQNTHTPHTTSIDDTHHTLQLKIITWNVGCINTSLPGILELTQTLHKDPHIILIQETKIHKLKSTSYIDRKLQNSKIIYNNSNNITQQPNRYSETNKARECTLIMIPKTIHTNENITKIPTPSTISPYLQIIMIKNKPITPILLINMYMPTHLQDLHLVQEIQTHIQTLTTNHPTVHIILAGDFNRDILLKGRSSYGTISPPNPDDYEWARFTQSIGLNIIHNQATHTRQGGHNYTLTSLIDGFYSNIPTHNTLQSCTITNLNQNSDHYPVQLILAPNSVIIKTTPTPSSSPRITYPIP
jgi:exonuclease III